MATRIARPAAALAELRTPEVWFHALFCLAVYLMHCPVASAQGTVQFNLRASGTSHIYAPLSPSDTSAIVGQGTNDAVPSGTTAYGGRALIGATLIGQYGAQTTLTSLLGAPGTNVTESSLVAGAVAGGNTATTFRTGTAAGGNAAAFATFGNIPPDAPIASFEVVAWDNSSGQYSTWQLAQQAWVNGEITAGKTPIFTLYNIGGALNTAPPLFPNSTWPAGAPTTGMQSFNLHYFSMCPAFISSQPQSQGVPVGQSVTFSVTASGIGPITYQWRFNQGDIQNATNSSYMIVSAQLSDAGDYSVFVSTGCGNVLSSNATLTVGYPPSILTQPQSQTVVAGQPASFSVGATGDAPLNYQWRFGGTDIAGATGTNYSIASAQPTNAGAYSVRISNAIGSTNSSIATLTVNVPPTITAQPTNLTVLTGSNALFTAAATGTAPLSYQWRHNGTNLPGATDTTLALTNVQSSAAGSYSVIVTNSVGVTNSGSAQLDVRYVFVYGNGQLLLGSNYTYEGSVTLEMRSGLGGSIYYTLNGSDPTFGHPYNLPFQLSRTAVVRAIAYSADFMQSGQAPPINITIIPTYFLSAITPGGGSISINPPGGVYTSNTTVAVTATASNGWAFLSWFGDASGSSPTTNVVMNRDKIVQAVFGTALSNTVAGGGSVSQYPTAALYPYGTVVRLTATAQPGNYFFNWGNAASGNTNPLYFTVTSTNATVSSLFAPLSGGQVALTAAPDGFGRVTTSPRANAYGFGLLVQLTATPDSGQSFLGWSGDASGTSNPLLITMDQSKVITGVFTRRPALTATTILDGPSADGFRFTLLGEFGAQYRIDGSTTLTDWSPLIVLTNTYGKSQFTDPAGTNTPYRFYRAAQVAP
jgi:hypothetical protein